MPRSKRSGSAPLRSVRGADGRWRVASGTPWEPKVGYARAVRSGARVYVSGTTATGRGGTVVGRGDPYRQTVRALDNIERALEAAGSSIADVVRGRVYVTRIGDFAPIARALGERFRPVRPALTLVAVRALVDPAMRVEIEVDAEDRPAVRAPSTRRGDRRARAYK
ncbi:MAG TPA: Rid family hydrolase [Thermoplasmata archaeon]|nr:Rid family hydrolase [Thermoplasmata archaeon]